MAYKIMLIYINIKAKIMLISVNVKAKYCTVILYHKSFGYLLFELQTSSKKSDN